MSAPVCMRIPLDKIVFSDIKIRDARRNSKQYEFMVESIKEFGVRTPIFVRPLRDADGKIVPDRYEGVDGCQRWNVSKDVGIKDILAFIADVDDDSAAALQMSLNKARVPQTKAEEFCHLSTFVANNPQMRQADVAKLHGITQAELSNILGLARLHEEAMAVFQEGKIKPSNAIALSRVPVDHQLDLLEEAQKMTIETFNTKCDEVKKELRDKKKGVKSPAVFILRQKSWFQDRHQELTELLEMSDPDDAEYTELGIRLNEIKRCLSVDEETLAQREAEKAAAKAEREKVSSERTREELLRKKAEYEKKLLELDSKTSKVQDSELSLA